MMDLKAPEQLYHSEARIIQQLMLFKPSDVTKKGGFGFICEWTEAESSP